MYTVLLTGGLASGKDTVCSWLAELGAATLDLDEIAHQELEDNVVIEQVTALFGEDLLDSEGQIIRPRLAERAFATPEQARQLNELIWPLVQERVGDFLTGGSCQPLEHAELMVVQIPLLAEAPQFLDLADEVVSISAPEQQRLQRAVQRGMTLEDAINRLQLQATDAQRAAISDTIWDNSGSLAQLHRQVQDWYRQRTQERLF
jgi:dephospho-CoA kinase